jgi:hypothetical protein
MADTPALARRRQRPQDVTSAAADIAERILAAAGFDGSL